MLSVNLKAKKVVFHNKDSFFLEIDNKVLIENIEKEFDDNINDDKMLEYDLNIINEVINRGKLDPKNYLRQTTRKESYLNSSSAMFESDLNVSYISVCYSY